MARCTARVAYTPEACQAFKGCCVSLFLLQCVELGPTGPLGETYYVNMANVLDRIKLQQLNRVVLDK